MSQGYRNDSFPPMAGRVTLTTMEQLTAHEPDLTTLQKLFPNFTEEQLREADEKLREYVAVIWEIYRSKKAREALSEGDETAEKFDEP